MSQVRISFKFCFSIPEEHSYLWAPVGYWILLVFSKLSVEISTLIKTNNEANGQNTFPPSQNFGLKVLFSVHIEVSLWACVTIVLKLTLGETGYNKLNYYTFNSKMCSNQSKHTHTNVLLYMSVSVFHSEYLSSVFKFSTVLFVQSAVKPIQPFCF